MYDISNLFFILKITFVFQNLYGSNTHISYKKQIKKYNIPYIQSQLSKLTSFTCLGFREDCNTTSFHKRIPDVCSFQLVFYFCCQRMVMFKSLLKSRFKFFIAVRVSVMLISLKKNQRFGQEKTIRLYSTRNCRIKQYLVGTDIKFISTRYDTGKSLARLVFISVCNNGQINLKFSRTFRILIISPTSKTWSVAFPQHTLTDLIGLNSISFRNN